MIRLAVAVGIIVAVGIFIVKPVLDTTDNAVNKANSSFEKSFGNEGIDTKAIEAKINRTIEEVNKQVGVQVERSFHVAKVHGNPQKLVHCIQRASGTSTGSNAAPGATRRARRQAARPENQAEPERARSKPDQTSPSGSWRSRRSKEPSRPPRLSIMWTRTASRVAGTTGEPCSSWPWWLRMMWRTHWASRGSKPGMSSIARRTV